MQTRKKPDLPTSEYLDKAMKLSEKDSKQIMSRLQGRFTRRYEDNRISAIDALALQLEYEDMQLLEWKKNLAEIRNP